MAYLASATSLYHMEGQDIIAYSDSSTNAFAVTVTGSVPLVSTVKKFGSTSASFNGSASNYLSVASNTNFDLGSTYTIEFWINPNSIVSNFGVLHRGFYNTSGSTWDNLAFSIRWLSTYARFYFYGTTHSDEQYIDVSNCFVANTWTHVAMVRSGTNGTVYINGVSSGTISGLNTPATSNKPLKIGVWDYNTASEWFNGYIDELRIIKGTAQYTSDFTPPTTPFSSSGATLLLHFDKLIDYGSLNQIPTITGVPVLSNVWSKFGTSSLYLDGSSGLNLASNLAFFGTTASNYTLSMWIYPTTISNTSGTHDVLFYVASGGNLTLSITQQKLMLFCGGTTTYTITGTTTLSTSTAYLVTVERYGKAMILYLNGNIEGYKYDTTAWAGWTGATIANIGHSNGGTRGGGTNQPYTGYIDEIAISTIARYQGTPFTPETTSLVIGEVPSTSIVNIDLAPTNANFGPANASGSMFSTSTAYSHSFNVDGFWTPVAGIITNSPIFVIPYVKPRPNYYGNAKFSGHVNIKGVIFPASVDLIDSVTGTIITTTLTNITTGAFTFEFLNPSLTYDIIATDLTNTYENLIISNQTPLANQCFNFQLIIITKSGSLIQLNDSVKLVIKGVGGHGTVTYSVDGAPGWMTVGILSGVITGTPPSGFQSYNIRTTDSLGNTGLYVWTFTVMDVNMSALLKFDGANNSTTFIDEKGSTVTRFGNAKISTTQSKFGGSSGYFDGASWLTVAYNNAFNLPGDFTIETNIYMTSVSGTQMIISRQNDGGGGMALQLRTFNDTPQFVMRGTASGSVITVSSSTTITTNTWYHLAATRTGTIVRLFINGTSVGSETCDYNLSDGSHPFVIAAADGNNPGSGNWFNGYIDEMLITKNVGKYTTNFTPPTAPF